MRAVAERLTLTAAAGTPEVGPADLQSDGTGAKCCVYGIGHRGSKNFRSKASARYYDFSYAVASPSLHWRRSAPGWRTRDREPLKCRSGDTLRRPVPAVPVVPPLEPFPG